MIIKGVINTRTYNRFSITLLVYYARKKKRFGHLTYFFFFVGVHRRSWWCIPRRCTVQFHVLQVDRTAPLLVQTGFEDLSELVDAVSNTITWCPRLHAFEMNVARVDVGQVATIRPPEQFDEHGLACKRLFVTYVVKAFHDEDGSRV